MRKIYIFIKKQVVFLPNVSFAYQMSLLLPFYPFQICLHNFQKILFSPSFGIIEIILLFKYIQLRI